MDVLQVTDDEHDKLHDAIEVIRKHGMKEARLIFKEEGEAWIIRQTAKLIEGGRSGS